MFIGDWMARGEQYWPERIAVVDVAKGEAGRFTYRQMNARANRLARWLAQRADVKRGDRVAILAHNGVEYLDAFFACGKLGAVLVALNWRLHPRELRELVDQTAPRALLYDEDFRAAAEEICAPHPGLRRVHLTGMGLADSEPYAKLQREMDATPAANEQVGLEDVSCLIFTGGTTGLPKGAQISYRMIAFNTLNTLIHELRPHDTTITHTPLFHTGGLFVYTVPLLSAGGTVVLMRRWSAEQMLELIHRERPTALFCVPTQYQDMLESPRFRQTDFSSLRYMTSGGAPLPVTLIQAYAEVHRVPFKQGFGMTEYGPGCFSLAPEHAVAKAGSIGKPNYFVEARLVDDDNAPVAPGEVGELVLKGPAMFSGYFNQPDASAAAFDPEGWFHTGDLARCDAEGYYYIVDRKKDMFISGGENVYPTEIERAFYEHPAVHQCAAIGVPDAKWGEVGKAFVVLKPGTQARPEELIDFVRGRLARYKVPKSVELTSALPLSPAGKILRRELRTQS